jgi:anthranilate phosphoribosyltransferase
MLTGGTKEENAVLLQKIFAGDGTPAQENAVALNTAAVLTVTGAAPDYATALAQAQEGLRSGAGARTLQKIIDFSNRI